jgi:hypothetical protein
MSFGWVSALADIAYEGARTSGSGVWAATSFRTDVSYLPDLKAYLAPVFRGKGGDDAHLVDHAATPTAAPGKTQEQVIQADGVVLDVPRRRAHRSTATSCIFLPQGSGARRAPGSRWPGSCTAPRWQIQQETSAKCITRT